MPSQPLPPPTHAPARGLLYCCTAATVLLQLYRHAGVPAAGFQGVPLFQAEGLTIKGDKARYTPLFFRCGGLNMAGPSLLLLAPVEGGKCGASRPLLALACLLPGCLLGPPPKGRAGSTRMQRQHLPR